jgi:putative membrane protein insertion efficiency factor
VTAPRPNLLRRVVVLPIGFYRRYLSRFKPPMCRFHPSCSAYAHEAILTHGPIRGTRLAVWRIMRCQPFAKGGLDPVPPGRDQGVPD